MALRIIYKLRDRGSAYSALGIVYYSKYAVVIAGIKRYSHVRKRILNFLTLEKSEAAENLIRNPV